MNPTTLLSQLAAVTLLAAPLAAQTTAPKPEPVKLTVADSTRLTNLGISYARWAVNGRADSLMTAMSAESLQGFGGPTGLTEMITTLAERGGVQSKVLADKLTRRNGLPQFWHEAEFSLFADEPLVMRFILDIDGKITGMGLGPKSRAPFDQ